MSEKNFQIGSDQNPPATLKEFKKLVRRAVFLARHEDRYFEMIPDATWEKIFAVNFEGNLAYASRVILAQPEDIRKTDIPRVNREKLKINSLAPAAGWVAKQLSDSLPVVFITDFDNDGSLSQAVLLEYLEMDKGSRKDIHIEYAQSLNGNLNRGFTVDMVDRIVQAKGWSENEPFLIVTADNGINSRDEQKKILEKYPAARLIVTDHHNPEPEMVVQEGIRTLVVNPKLNPTPFFQEYNISGANTLAVLMKEVLAARQEMGAVVENVHRLENVDKLSRVANLLDYVHTAPADKPAEGHILSQFLHLQPLLNINNSISKIITGGVNEETMSAITAANPGLRRQVFDDAAENIHVQNQMAHRLLELHRRYRDVLEQKKTAPDGGFVLPQFHEYMVGVITEDPSIPDNINPNFIEQLRPLIFQLSADDDKDVFLDQLNEKMIGVFSSVKTSEQQMAQELRVADVVTTRRLENSVIVHADTSVTRMFNRKFLNKVYNDENPGFSLTLDSVGRQRVSGSFRSLFDISDIMRNKKKLERRLKISIETPGHERAAGFIVRSLDVDKPITGETLEAINIFVDKSIRALRKEIKARAESRIVTDLTALQLIDRINLVVRGNVSNFERISPLINLSKDTVWTDSYTTEQFSMESLVKERKFGYISINTNFDGHTVIIPIELIRRIVENDYRDYLSLGYMDGGVFIADRVVRNGDVKNIVDLREVDDKTSRIAAAFEKNFSDSPLVHLSRDQIRDNPFFKYNTSGDIDFNLFERMVMEVIDSHEVEMLTVFDVEANGFGNSQLMNFGAMNYCIDENFGDVCTEEDFDRGICSTSGGERVWLSDEDIRMLAPVSLKDKEKMPASLQRSLLTRKNEKGAEQYFNHPEIARKHSLKDDSPVFLVIRNSRSLQDGTVVYNRQLRAEMLAYLVKDGDFRVPQVMTNLTGITQELLDRYGMQTSLVDESLGRYYEGRKVLFGAHNTPYDARVLRANTPSFYRFMKSSSVYDSALFAKDEKLAYDDIKVSRFVGIKGVPAGVFFYDSPYSDLSLSDFLEKNTEGYFPDRTNKYLLGIENGAFFLIDKTSHDKVKLDVTREHLQESMEHRRCRTHL